MTLNRSYSAPPFEKFILKDDVELGEIRYEVEYTNYYKKNRNPRLEPPRFLFTGQSSIWASEYNDVIIRAFSEKKTAVEMINMEFPDSGTCSEFSGKSRTTSPIGDNSFIVPSLVQNKDKPIMVQVAQSLQKAEASTLIDDLGIFYNTLFTEATSDPKTICVSVCKDQEGSRHVQGLIDSWSSEQIDYFFGQIIEHALDLSTNLFGNYVIQKIIFRLSENQLFDLILKFFGHIYELSLHVYGCRVVQKLIDHLKDIQSIMAELEPHISELIASPNGNHVIQKCIDKEIDRGFLLKEFENNCVELAQQRYGCRVLQRLFEVCSEEETWCIYLQIIKNIGVLINDKYGNYVIQHLIQTPNKLKKNIFSYIIGNSFTLSKDKFSSNVVERCINSSEREHLELFLAEFSKIHENSKPRLYFMCVDMYANYVVQKFYDVSDESLRSQMRALIKPYMKDMRAIPYTKQVVAMLSGNDK